MGRGTVNGLVCEYLIDFLEYIFLTFKFKRIAFKIHASNRLICDPGQFFSVDMKSITNTHMHVREIKIENFMLYVPDWIFHFCVEE